MRTGQAFLIGIIAAGVMSAILTLARAMGMPVNLAMMLGTTFGGPADSAHWVMGFVTHLIAGGLFGVVYAAAFEYLTRRAGWVIGLAFGAVNALISGVFLGMVPPIHALIPNEMPAPGPFMANLGVEGIVLFVAPHLIYGAIVGALYAPVRRAVVSHVRDR